MQRTGAAHLEQVHLLELRRRVDVVAEERVAREPFVVHRAAVRREVLVVEREDSAA